MVGAKGGKGGSSKRGRRELKKKETKAENRNKNRNKKRRRRKGRNEMAQGIFVDGSGQWVCTTVDSRKTLSPTKDVRTGSQLPHSVCRCRRCNRVSAAMQGNGEGVWPGEKREGRGGWPNEERGGFSTDGEWGKREVRGGNESRCGVLFYFLFLSFSSLGALFSSMLLLFRWLFETETAAFLGAWRSAGKGDEPAEKTTEAGRRARQETSDCQVRDAVRCKDRICREYEDKGEKIGRAHV